MKGIPRQVGLRPFFSFLGSKNGLAKHYPVPQYPTIIEPFAGSAGYSCRYYEKKVVLFDIDEKIVGIWRYLIKVDPVEILRLPLQFDHVDEIRAPQEAKWLIGFCLGRTLTHPKNRPSYWMRSKMNVDGSAWSSIIRHRIAQQVRKIRHWQIRQYSYQDLENQEATWFVDPPYQKAGVIYKHGSKDIEFEALSDWCQSRKGQVIVCENLGAEWLPFKPLRTISGTKGRQTIEAVWYNP